MTTIASALAIAAASPTAIINPADGDGINWQLSRTSAFIRKIRPAATGWFVCGGGDTSLSADYKNQYLATTTDFAQFTSITLPSITAAQIGYGYAVSDVCYANNTIIAACDGRVGTANWAILLKSTDNGSTWTEINLGNYTPYDIVFCDGRWVLSTNLTTIFYSSDNFATYNTIDSVSNFNYLAVSGTTVLVGHSTGLSSLTFSPNPTLISRTSILTALGSSTDVRNVVVDADTVGDVIYVLTSSGAVAIWNNFTSSQLILSGSFGGFKAYARIGDRRILSGGFYGYTSTTVGPTNGGAAMTWTSNSTLSDLSDAIAVGSNIFLVGRQGYIVSVAVSGSTYTANAVGYGYSAYTLAAYGNGTFVVAKSGANSIITSTDDGKSWSAAGQNNAITATQYSLKFLNGKFYMGCGSGKIYYSTDGKTWTAATVNLNSGVGVHYDFLYMNSGRLVTVGTLASQGGNAISYISDDDGLTWNRGTSNFPTLHSGSGGITLASLEYDGTYVYAYSSIGNTAFYSSDGSTWTLLRAADRTHTSIAANSTIAVAIGQGIIQKSDGNNNWTIVATPNIATANKVVWLSSTNQFVILGTNGYLATLDSTATTLTTYPSTGGSNTDIIYDAPSGKYIAAIGGSIKTSTDLTTWTTTSASGTALAYAGGSTYITVGSLATLWFSADAGVTWNNVPTMLFNGDFTSVVWHAATSKWWTIFNSAGVSYIYNSADGQTWTLNAQSIVPVSSKCKLVVRDGILTLLGTSSNAGIYYFEYNDTVTGGAGAGKYAWISRGSNERFTSTATNGSTRIFGSNRGELFKVTESTSFIDNTFTRISVNAGSLPATHYNYNTFNGVLSEAPTNQASNGTSINDITYWDASGTSNANQNTFYAVTNAVLYGTKRSGLIVQSSDGGSTWTTKVGANGITTGPYPHNIYGIASRAGSSGSLLAIADYGRLVIQTNLNNTNANFTQWGFGRSFVDYVNDGAGMNVAIGLSPDTASVSTFGSARLGQYGGLYYSSTAQAALSPTMSWTQVGGDTDKFTSLAYSPSASVWVAVGLGGIISSSSGGATWVSRTSGTTNNLFKVYWSQTASQFIAVGESGTVVTSSDGTTWTTRNTGSTGCFYDVTEFFQGGVGTFYVIVGQTGSLPSGTTTPLLINSTSLTNNSWAQVTSFGAALTKTISAISYDSLSTGKLLISGANSSGNIVFAETSSVTTNALSTWTAKTGTYGTSASVAVTGITAYNSNFYITALPRVFLKYDTTANTISDCTYTAFTGDADAPTQTWSGKAPSDFTRMSSSGVIVGTNGFMAVPSGSNFTIKCPGYSWISIASDGSSYVLTANNFTGYSVGVVVTTTTTAPQDGLTPRQAGSFSANKVKYVGSYYIAFGGSYLSASYYMYSSDGGVTWTEKSGNIGSYVGNGYKDVVLITYSGQDYYYFLDSSSSVTNSNLFRTNSLATIPSRVSTAVPSHVSRMISQADGEITFYGQGYYLAKSNIATSDYSAKIFSGLFGPGSDSTLSMAKATGRDEEMMSVIVGNSIQIFGSADGVRWKSINYLSGSSPSSTWLVKYIKDNAPVHAFYLCGVWGGGNLNWVWTDFNNLATSSSTSLLNLVSTGAFASSRISDIEYSTTYNKGIVTTADGNVWVGTPTSGNIAGTSPSNLLLDTNISYNIFRASGYSGNPDRYFFISQGTSPIIRWTDNISSFSGWSYAPITANKGLAVNSVSYSPTVNKFVLMGASGNILNSTTVTSTFDTTMYQRNSTAGLSSSINFSKCIYASDRLYIASSNNDVIYYTPTVSSYSTPYSLSLMNTSSINTAVTDMIQGGTNKIILSYAGSIRVVDTSANTVSTVQILDVGTSGMSRVAKKGSEYIWTGNSGALMTTNYDGTLMSPTYNYKIPYVGSSPFIRYANGVFLIGGSENIYYGFTSPINAGNMYPTIASSSGAPTSKPVWTGNKFIFGASLDRIYTSNDGTSWTLRRSSNNPYSSVIYAIGTKPTAPKANIAVGHQIFRN